MTSKVPIHFPHLTLTYLAKNNLRPDKHLDTLQVGVSCSMFWSCQKLTSGWWMMVD